MLSIIIPTLNEEKYINKLLNSLKNQFYRNYEVIIVDGGSTDMTEQVVQKFRPRFKRLDFIKTTEKNIPKQRNTGAKVAIGDILVFLDADIIIYDQNFLGIIAKAFNYDEKCGGLMSYLEIDPKEAILSDKIFHSVNNFWLKVLHFAGISLMKGASMIIRKDAFSKIKGFNENLVVAEDLELCLRLRKVTKIRNSKLMVYESPRRYRKIGYLKLMWIWTYNGLSSLLFKKTPLKTWEAVR